MVVTSLQQKDTEDEVREIIRSNLHLQGKVKKKKFFDNVKDWDMTKSHFAWSDKIWCVIFPQTKSDKKIIVWNSL